MIELEKKEMMIDYARYFVGNNATVRSVAKKFGVSKSQVHRILSSMSENKFVLKEDKELAKQAKSLLEKNKQERHIRGGNATKKKYMLLKES